MSCLRFLHVNPRAEISVSHALSTHSFPPAWNWKTHPRDTDTCTSASQVACCSKTASSFPASSSLFSVFSTPTQGRQYPEQGLPQTIRSSTLVSHTSTWNAEFHTPVNTYSFEMQWYRVEQTSDLIKRTFCSKKCQKIFSCFQSSLIKQITVLNFLTWKQSLPGKEQNIAFICVLYEKTCYIVSEAEFPGY